MQELIKSLIKARGEFSPIEKDRINPHFKHKYATLDSVLTAVMPSLGKYGLTVLQTTAIADGRTVLETHLLHESGESIKSVYPLPDIPEPQKFGAAITYARRYALCAMLNVTADEDDDGSAASQLNQKKQASAPSTNGNGEHPNVTRVRTIRSLFGIDKQVVADYLKSVMVVSNPMELKPQQIDSVVLWMATEWGKSVGINQQQAESSFRQNIPPLLAQGRTEIEAIQMWMEYAKQQLAGAQQ